MFFRVTFRHSSIVIIIKTVLLSVRGVLLEPLKIQKISYRHVHKLTSWKFVFTWGFFFPAVSS